MSLCSSPQELAKRRRGGFFAGQRSPAGVGDFVAEAETEASYSSEVFGGSWPKTRSAFLHDATSIWRGTMTRDMMTPLHQEFIDSVLAREHAEVER